MDGEGVGGNLGNLESNNNNDESLIIQWQTVNVIDKSLFVPRWGHMACAVDQNIYIYGGRSYNDHSDLLLLETNK